MNACEEYEVPNEKKVQFLYHILQEDARIFYDDKIRDRVTQFSEACSIMNSEYNSIARQNRVRNQLNALRVSQLNKNCNDSEALEKIHRKITKLYLLGPAAYRTDAHKLDYLRSAVIGMPWAREALNRSQ